MVKDKHTAGFPFQIALVVILWQKMVGKSEKRNVYSNKNNYQVEYSSHDAPQSVDVLGFKS